MSNAKPAISTMLVMSSAFPTESKAYLIALLFVEFLILRAFKYFVKKWTVSSITIPKVIPVTTESDKPTWPTKIPQIPKPITAGTRLATRLTSQWKVTLKKIARLLKLKIWQM